MWSALEGLFVGGRYEIRRHIATGGMAAVFYGWDHRVERPVAIKVLHQLQHADQAAIARFQREAHAAARLNHPNVVRAYDFFEDDGCCFLVMEYVAGITLKQWLRRRGALPAGVALTIAEQVCAALDAAHALGFIHRDIKPQNILLNGQGMAKVTDFGIVHITRAAALTTDSLVLGTADYIAPEQARGATLSQATDVYALGVVLYEMLTARLPFKGPSPVAVAEQHAHAPVPPPRRIDPTIAPYVQAIVLRALEKEPARRYPSAAALALALRRAREALAAEAGVNGGAPEPAARAPALVGGAPADGQGAPEDGASARAGAAVLTSSGTQQPGPAGSEDAWRELAIELLPQRDDAAASTPGALAAWRMSSGHATAIGLMSARMRALVLAVAALVLAMGTIVLDVWLRTSGSATPLPLP